MQDDLSQIERRITLRLLAYWEKQRGSRSMPAEQDIDPDHIPDLWDNCFLIHVADLAKPDYNYVYLGDAIIEAYKAGLSEDDRQSMLSPNASSLSHNYERIITTRLPIIEEGEFYNLHNDLVKFRQCLLPLGKGDKVEAIFGGMRYKIFLSRPPK